MDDEDRVEAILGLRKAHNFLKACEDEEPVITNGEAAEGYRWARWAVAELAGVLTDNVQSKGYWRRQAGGLLYVAQEASRESKNGNTGSDWPTEESPR